ncbi:MAG: hypothetical protein NTX22_12855 [Ignavibacteriales bacterium]|nr:hypothetical protein [Ignavibacteriales bacterium]
MKTLLIKNSCVEVGILKECGHLFPVRFFFDKEIIEPMHISPWTNEELDPSVPPMLQYLRGDFFCAPFGDSDLLVDESRAHGTSANDKWDDIQTTKSSIKLKLSKKISGSELIKEININDDESVIYQKHTFVGGDGKIPVGHHAMLKIPNNCFISFSDFAFGGTPSQAVETDPGLGKSILKYPQQFSDLTLIQRSDGNLIDASVYPFDTNHEDLFMIISKQDIPFGWSAVSCPDKRWLWYSIKNKNILPNTVVWLSNGGRYYPPFSSRHKNVIGIEETASFFHLGHKASVEKNFLNERGFKTFIELSPNKVITIPYLFGVVKIPGNFGRVKSIKEFKDGIEITDNNQLKVQAKVNLNFIKDNK